MPYYPPPSSGGGTTIKTGTATVDFGTDSQQSDIAIVTVSEPTYLTTKEVMLTIKAIDTSNHNPEDFAIESLTSYATNFVNGVGFDIICRAPNLTYGQYTISYLF